MHRRRDLVLVGLAFVASGAAGLVYQVVWSRTLGEVFGVSTNAITAVLATYLGGLALGGWLLGPLADRWDALRVYGLLELGIAATALAGSVGLRMLDPVHVWAATRLSPTSPVLLLVRIALASVVVLPPTLLMGATLPAITRALVDRVGKLGRGLSLLYALNTAGAVAGSVLAGFVLIRAVGVHRTLFVAVAVNVAVGAAALVVAARRRALAPLAPERVTLPGAVEPDPTAPADRAGPTLLLAMALSGVASLCLEVIWTRMLVVLVGTSTYAFVTMLTTFLVGITLGSLAARGFVPRLRSGRRALGWIQLGITASTLATLPLTRWVLESGRSWFVAREASWAGLLSGRFVVSFLIMILPTTLIGTTLPLAATIWARSTDTLGRRLGQVYAANTFGNVLGAALGGFAVLPLLGMQKGIALVATFNLFGAGWGFAPDVRRGSSWARIGRAAPIAVCLASSVLLLWAWTPSPLPGSGGAALDPVLFYAEGPVSTVKVFQHARDGRQLLMAVDGITIGQSSTGVDKKQQVLAHLPFMLARRPPERVLSIGLGTGILIGEVVRHPGVASVECVELSPSVIEGARQFEGWNGGVLRQPNVHVVNDDGVNYLKRTSTRYDAIISDGKSRSGHAGNALFYSLDYYRSALDHLANDGTMVQWVPLDVGAAEFKIIVRTFTRAFPHAYMWLGQDSSFLVGSRSPLALDLPHVQRVLDAPETEHLRRHGWRRAEDVASLLVADTAVLRRWVADAADTNSLEHPILELYAPGAFAGDDPDRVADNLSEIARLRREPLEDVVVSGGDAAELAASSRAVGDLVSGLVARARGAREAQGLLWRALADAPDHGVVHQIVGEAIFSVALGLDRAGDFDAAIREYGIALEASPALAEASVNLGRALAVRGRTADATVALREAIAANPRSGSAHMILGDILRAEGLLSEAESHYRVALDLAPADAELRDRLAVSLAMRGQTDVAALELRRAIATQPDLPTPQEHLAVLLASDPRLRNPPEAVRLARSAARLTHRRDPVALEALAAAFASTGDFDDAIVEEEKAIELLEASGAPNLGDARATLDSYRRRVPPYLGGDSSRGS